MNRAKRINIISVLAGLAFAFTATILGGCSTAPRTLENDKGVQRVAVVSLINENAEIAYIGPTVFHNKFAGIDQHGELNKIATDSVAQRLRSARPQWTVIPVTASDELGRKSRASISLGGFTSPITADLQRIARETDADLVFAVIEHQSGNFPGKGVGVWMRSLNGVPLGNTQIHANLLLVLLDKNAKEITVRSGWATKAQAAELGLTADLQSLQDPVVEQRVSNAMRKQLASAMTDAAKYMGY